MRDGQRYSGGMAATARETPDSATDKPIRHRFWAPASLRLFAAMILVLGISAIWVGGRAYRQRVVIREIERISERDVDTDLQGPIWLRRWVGDDRMAVFDEPVRVDLSDRPVSDDVLRQVGQLTTLRELSLASTPITNAGLTHLTGLKRLRKLNLYHTQITDAGLVHLKRLVNLQELTLIDTPTSRAGVADLQASIPGLTKVYYLSALTMAKRPPDADYVRRLVEQLAIPAAGDEPEAELEKRMRQREIAQNAIAASEKLRDLGVDAFTFLLDALDDDRPSVTCGNLNECTVGIACRLILEQQIYALPEDYRGSFYRSGKDGESHERPVFSKSIFAGDMRLWFQERSGRSLHELQLEGLGWVLAEEEKIGAATPEDDERFLQPLRAKYAALMKHVQGKR